MEYQDDDREYIRPPRPQSMTEAYQALYAQRQATVTDILRRWEAKELTATEAWGLLPGHPQPAGATTAYISEVRYPFAGEFWPLYQAVVQESGGDPSRDRNYIRPEYSQQHLSQYSARKNAEDEQLRTLRTRAEEEERQKRQRQQERRRYVDDEEERVARIVRAVLRDLRE
jgi:hypothetical protein